MKFYYTLIALLFSCIYSNGQDIRRIDTVRYPSITRSSQTFQQFNSDFKYTISLKGFGIDQMAPTFDKGTDHTYDQTYLNQIGLMINDYQLSYRFFVQHREGKSSIDNACEGCPLVKGNLKATHLRVGFQKHFNYARFQPYIGADLGYLYQTYDGSTQQISNGGSNEVKFDELQHAGTISPFLGFKWYMSPQFSIYAESTAHLALSRYRTDITGDSQREGSPYRIKDHRFAPYFAPLSIGIQYHFGFLQF
jgi:hypothetical protein